VVIKVLEPTLVIVLWPSGVTAPSWTAWLNLIDTHQTTLKRNKQ